MSMMHQETRSQREALREEFLKRALSCLAHDLKNHLASINETAGWLEDLLKFHRRGLSSWLNGLLGSNAKRTGIPEKDQFFDIASRIQGRVQVMAQMVDRLGRFSHRFGIRDAFFDPYEVCEEVVTFLQRRAYERQVKLAVEGPQGSQIQGDPTCFYLAIFCIVESALSHLPKEAVLTLRSDITEDALILSAVPSGPPQGPDEDDLSERVR